MNYKCECGKVCKSKGGLATHQRFCKVFKKEQVKPDLPIPEEKKKEEKEVEIYIKTEVTINSKKYCGHVTVSPKLARTLLYINDRVDWESRKVTQVIVHPEVNLGKIG